jgi:hypothetical protein
MPEGEVALLLAEYLLAHQRSDPRVDVAVDGASVLAHGSIVFDIKAFLSSRDWVQVSPDKGRNDWTGEYSRAAKILCVHSRSGIGDVVCAFGDRKVIAECKKGPLIRKPGSPERPLLANGLGQALITKCSPQDIVVAAVPHSELLPDLWTDFRVI